MSELGEGDVAPDFTLPANGDSTVRLSDYRGRFLVLYFYPRDDTSGCTLEAVSFTEHASAFDQAGGAILGVSRDDPASHDAFCAKHALTIPLASDLDGRVCEAYGVWVEKAMYGRKYMGIERTTLLIRPDGRIARIWRKVKLPGHVPEVLEALKKQAIAG